MIIDPLIRPKAAYSYLHSIGSYCIALAIFIGLIAQASFCEERELKSETSDKLDAVLLLDSSGSMRVTDPGKLREEGAKLFVQSLRPGDRLAIVEFSGEAKVIRPLSEFQSDQVAQIDSNLASVSDAGLYTDLLAGIESAKKILDESGRPDASQLIILLSDGKMDPDPKLGSALVRVNDLVNNYLPDLKTKGVRVYTLYFSDEADKEILSSIASATDGLNWFAPSADKIHDSYLNLFLSVKKPQVVPFKSRGFTIDKDVEEATFYINHDEGTPISLSSPDNATISATAKDPSVKWYAGKNFDVVTISKPTVGDWQMIGLPAGDSFATVLTNIKLVTDWPSNIYAATPVLLQARLYEGEKPLALQEMSQVTQYGLQITPTDRVAEPLARAALHDDGEQGDKIAGDGIFSGLVTLDDPGEYKLRIVAKSPTYERNQQIPFRVKPRLVSVKVVPAEEEHHDPHGAVEGGGEAAGPPSDQVFVELSTEAGTLKQNSLTLVAIDEHKSLFDIPLTPSKQSKLVYTAKLSFEHAGEYELKATLNAETKKKERIRAESQPVKYNFVIKSEEATEHATVKKVEKKDNTPPPVWPYALVVVVLNIGAGLFATMTLKKSQSKASFTMPEVAGNDDALAAIADLEQKMALTEIDLDDPIFSDDKIAKQASRRRSEAGVPKSEAAPAPEQTQSPEPAVEQEAADESTEQEAESQE